MTDKEYANVYTLTQLRVASGLLHQALAWVGVEEGGRAVLTEITNTLDRLNLTLQCRLNIGESPASPRPGDPAASSPG